MIYLAAGIYCGALVVWFAMNEAVRYRRRKRVLARLETYGPDPTPPAMHYNCRSSLTPAVPHPSDPEAPKWTEAQCRALPGGHATVTRHRLGMLMRSCPRCGWWERERVEWRPDADFDARR